MCFVLQSSSVCHMCLSIDSSRCNPPQGSSLHISLSLSYFFYVSFQWRYIVVVPSPMRQLAVFIQLTCHSRFLVDSFSVEPSHKYYVHVVFSQSILTLLVVGLIQFPGESSSDPRFCTRSFFLQPDVQFWKLSKVQWNFNTFPAALQVWFLYVSKDHAQLPWLFLLYQFPLLS
jgi:hypothetical protein